MSPVAIIVASSEFISALFVRIKIHKAEITNFSPFLYIPSLRKKKLANHRFPNNLMTSVSKKETSKSVKIYVWTFSHEDVIFIECK